MKVMFLALKVGTQKEMLARAREAILEYKITKHGNCLSPNDGWDFDVLDVENASLNSLFCFYQDYLEAMEAGQEEDSNGN